MWSEVWALLIPLIVIAFFKPKGKAVRLLIIYVISAFILIFLAIFTLAYPNLVPNFLSYNYNNNVFYNAHSFIMTIFFSWYIISLKKYKKSILLNTLLILYIAFVLINFAFLETPLILSTRHFTAGSIVLLIMCLYYFIHSIQEESQTNWLKHPSFIICSAIFMYQAITFFIYLFFYPMFNQAYNKDLSFALLMMRIYQIAFVMFCILLAIGLYQYRSGKNTKPA
jgi:hypothetical protein